MVTNISDNLSIAVIIPAFNAGEYIGRCIDSVLSQSRPADEIIIVDDGSTDNTAEIVRQYESKIKYVYQQNAGETAARNTGIIAATCEWIAFLDADDEWLADKLLLQAKVLEDNPDISWATSNYYRCLCGENIRRAHYPPNKADKLLQNRTYFENFFDAFIAEVYGCSDTMIVKKETLIQVGLFNVGQTRAGDMDLWWRIAFHHPKIACVPHPLAIYHLNIPTCASNTFKDWHIYTDMIDRNLEKAKELDKLAEFTPAASYILRKWIRAMLFDGEAEPIRNLLDSGSELLRPGYRLFIRILISAPKVTASVCQLISKIVRVLGIGKNLVRPPK